MKRPKIPDVFKRVNNCRKQPKTVAKYKKVVLTVLSASMNEISVDMSIGQKRPKIPDFLK